MPSEDGRIRRSRDQTSALAKKRTLDGPCGSLEHAARALDPYNRVIEENAAEDSSCDAFLLSIRPEHGGTQLWIRDDVTSDPQAVIDFVLRCAEEFGLTGRWGFQWANTCSRPRVNAFGGGAHVLDLGRTETAAWIAI